jgi:hypothetical protein
VRVRRRRGLWSGWRFRKNLDADEFGMNGEGIADGIVEAFSLALSILDLCNKIQEDRPSKPGTSIVVRCSTVKAIDF